MDEGDRVRMISFKGRKYAPTPLNPESLRELLLGCTGTVVEGTDKPSSDAGFTEGNHVLVKFDTDLRQLGLYDDTGIPNSLWIPERDLELV